MKTLLLGCGNSRLKIVHTCDQPDWDGELVTLDMNPNCNADVLWDLEFRPLPFDDGTFDEIHAYDVLEHLGRQGDWRGYFDEWSEYHRLLKPGGLMAAMVPIGMDALADPGHTRFFYTNHFWMLSQAWYADSIANGDRVTDYRWYWRKDFHPVSIQFMEQHHIVAVMRKEGA